MCLLNADGARSYQISLDSLFVQVLTTALPDRFAVVQDQEDCSDNRDNNCDGEVNEGCNEEPSVWGAGQDCESCMAQECATQVEECEESEICEDIVTCAVQAKCLDKYLGPITCLCGKGSSVNECQRIDDQNYNGDCVQEFLAQLDPEAPFGPWGPRVKDGSGSAVLTCMGRHCQSECTELVYND